MNETPAKRGGAASHVAVLALLQSVLINMAAPALLYRLAAPHAAPGSLIPLAISGLPPILWLAYGIVRLRAVDFLGLFAAENILVRVTALVLAGSVRGALIGRSLENVILAAIFFGSLAFARPLLFYMSRQLSTGNNPATRAAFDMAENDPAALKAYRVLTWVWGFGLLIKAGGGYLLAANLPTQDYLVFSPLWDMTSDAVLVGWSILYGHAHL